VIARGNAALLARGLPRQPEYAGRYNESSSGSR
jgi:hypothetical protein